MHAPFAATERTLTKAEKIAELRRLVSKASRWVDQAESDEMFRSAYELLTAYRGQLEDLEASL